MVVGRASNKFPAVTKTESIEMIRAADVVGVMCACGNILKRIYGKERREKRREYSVKEASK